MESKPVDYIFLKYVGDSFNRTSMESKLALQGMFGRRFLLLIEPVWNRNYLHQAGNLWTDLLLIEPVWNRNILPVWIFRFSLSPFNRTSMESKHFY